MKNVLRVFVSLLMVSIPFSSSFSQENKDDEGKKYTTSLHPLAIFWGGVKVDFGMKLKEKQWLVAMPTIYVADGIKATDYEAKGFGLDLFYKRYLNRNENIYLLGGLSNTFFHAKYSYGEYYSDNYTERSGSFNFDKLGTSVSVGINTNLQKGLYVDFYMGVGYQYSFYNKDNRAFHPYSLCYRGLYPTFGLSVGYAW